MKLNYLSGFIAAAALAASSTAGAVTAIINFEGVVDEATVPGMPHVEDRITAWNPATGLGRYSGQIVVGGMEDWYEWNRVEYTNPDGSSGSYWDMILANKTIDFDTDMTAGFRLNGGSLRAVESGGSARIMDPDADFTIPHCHERSWDRGRCAPDATGPNQYYQDRSSGVNYGELLGTATAEVVNGMLDSFSYSIDRSTPEFAAYDAIFADAGLALQVEGLTLELGGFEFVEAMGDVVIFEATEYHSTFTVSAVPIPAAVWMFGSAILGLVGVARRRQA